MKPALAKTLFGPGSTPGDWAWGIFFIMLIAGGLIAVGYIILKLLRGTGENSANIVNRIMMEVQSIPLLSNDVRLVELRFTVYTTFLLWGNQISVHVHMPEERARAALEKMLRHNLNHGWFGPGGLFVPVLTLIEYFQQSRSLSRQEERNAVSE